MPYRMGWTDADKSWPCNSALRSIKTDLIRFYTFIFFLGENDQNINWHGLCFFPIQLCPSTCWSGSGVSVDSTMFNGSGRGETWGHKKWSWKNITSLCKLIVHSPLGCCAQIWSSCLQRIQQKQRGSETENGTRKVPYGEKLTRLRQVSLQRRWMKERGNNVLVV